MSLRRSNSTPAPEPMAPELQESAIQAHAPRYSRPKVLVIDAPDIYETLEKRGYAATSGTFGQPFILEPEGGYITLAASAHLPEYREQEIVIADLIGPEAKPLESKQVKSPAPGVNSLWIPTNHGLVDPRPAAMVGVRSEMDRILKHGGIFILFSAPRAKPDYIFANRTPTGRLDYSNAVAYDATNWDMLSDLQWLSVSSDSGQEMYAADNGVPRTLGIDKYFTSGRFGCTITPPSNWGRWITLAVNKYGDPVAGVLTPKKDEEKTAGLIFVLPHIERRSELVQDLMEHALPELRPQLFPDTEGSRWTRRPEYELPRVSTLKTEIIQIEEEMRARIRELEDKIQAERLTYGFLHDLLTGSGESLVQAVNQTLRFLGFNDVRDADAEAKESGESGNLREDLRIMDARVPILVEIKGIAGFPREASSLQVTKYLIPRMREWNRSDLRGLAIVNHQRNMPALQREHENVFQPDIVSNAEVQGFGLLTTWDLFRLTRGFISNGWDHEDIAELFVSSGRVQPIPAHYEYIGRTDDFFPQAAVVGIHLESTGLRMGDRVAYELPVDFIEEEITSLQIDKQTVDNAEIGDYAGVKTHLTKEQARKNTRVFKINRHKAESED